MWPFGSLVFFFFCFGISWQIMIKFIRSKSLFLWYSFIFNVLITHEIITFQDICICQQIQRLLKIWTIWTDSRPGTWSNLSFAGVRECPPWCTIVGATVTVHQFFCILYVALIISGLLKNIGGGLNINTTGHR